MTIQMLLKGISALLLLGGVGWLLANGQWRYQSLGEIEVRRHGLTGAIELKEGGVWRAPAIAETRAPAVPSTLLKTVTIAPPSGSWGEGRLVAFTATTKEPVKGRLAVRIVVRDKQNRVVMRGDKSVRITVDWPGGARVPVVLDSTMTRPPYPHVIELSLESIHQQE